MIHRNARIVALALGVLLLSGHVGSSTIFYEGEAGPYAVRVVIRPPEVIPGQAEISVRALGSGVERVNVRPVRWDLGLEGAPRPDPARPVPGEPSLWSAQLWLMDFGSYSVHVTVDGALGTGSVIVPVAAVATGVKTMPVPLALPLIGLGLLLLVGVLTLVGAAVREAVLPSGERPGPERERRARVAQGLAIPVLALTLFGGSKWWELEDTSYGENVYRAPEVTTAMAAADARVLTLQVNDWATPWGARWSPLIPDHGKLMHMFLVRDPGHDAFAHLHPERLDSATFHVALPPLPGGKYRVYADIVHESGFLQTLTDTVDVPGPTVGGEAPQDPDDSWIIAAPSRSSRFRAADGSTMVWDQRARPLGAREETTLRFQVLDPEGAPGVLEPYMGMLAHAAVTRDDGAVFVHLHPAGTLSMTAQLRFEQITRGDTLRGPDGALILESATPTHADHRAHGSATGVVEFPFEFPRPGRYTIWVQFKRAGEILTAAFDTEVR